MKCFRLVNEHGFFVWTYTTKMDQEERLVCKTFFSTEKEAVTWIVLFLGSLEKDYLKDRSWEHAVLTRRSLKDVLNKYCIEDTV